MNSDSERSSFETNKSNEIQCIASRLNKNLTVSDKVDNTPDFEEDLREFLKEKMAERMSKSNRTAESKTSTDAFASPSTGVPFNSVHELQRSLIVQHNPSVTPTELRLETKLKLWRERKRLRRARRSLVSERSLRLKSTLRKFNMLSLGCLALYSSLLFGQETNESTSQTVEPNVDIPEPVKTDETENVSACSIAGSMDLS